MSMPLPACVKPYLTKTANCARRVWIAPSARTVFDLLIVATDRAATAYEDTPRPCTIAEGQCTGSSSDRSTFRGITYRTRCGLNGRHAGLYGRVTGRHTGDEPPYGECEYRRDGQ